MSSTLTLSNLQTSVTTDAQSTMAGIRSFKEYCDAFANKLMKFLEGTSEDVSNKVVLSLTHRVDDFSQKIYCLTKEQYNAALDDEEAIINVALSNVRGGDTLALTGKEIIEELEEQTAEIQCQGEFLGYLLNNEGVKATDFMTAARVKFTTMKGDIIDKYSRLIVENSAIDSITNFFSLTSNTKTYKRNEGTQNEYIEVVSTQPYVGANPWGAAFEQIGAEISSFFSNVVWNGILHIGEFFKAILDGLVKLAKWFMAKAFKPIMTNFAKASPKDGIVDLPVLQFKIGYLSPDYVNKGYTFHNDTFKLMMTGQFNACVDKLNPVSPAGKPYLWYGIGAPNYNNYMNLGLQFSTDFVYYLGYMVENLCKPLVYQLDDSQIVRPYDVIIPSGGKFHLFSATPTDGVHSSDMLIRIGAAKRSNNDYLDVWLQLFLVTNYDEWSQFNDSQNFKRMIWSTQDCFEYITALFGTCPNLSNSNNINMGNWTDYTNAIKDCLFDASGIDVTDEFPLDWASRMKGIDSWELVSYNSFSEAIRPFFMTSLIYFCGLMGPASESMSEWDYQSLWFEAPTDEGTSHYYQDIYIDYESSFDFQSWTAQYKPYSQYNITPAAVHYQTMNERISEAKSYIYAAIIAIATIVVAVTVTKFVKRRNAKLSIAQAALDNYSWSLSQNPSSSEIKNYMKMKHKVNRIKRMNGLLGISSGSDFAESNAHNLVDITRQLLSSQGYSPDVDNETVTLTTIKECITG